MSTPVLHPRLGALLAAALAVLPGAATTAAAEPSGPGPLDAARLQRMDRDAVSLAPDAARSDREIGAVLARTGEMSRAASDDLATFLRIASLTALLAEAAPAAGGAAQAPAGEFDVGPGGTRVLSDGGMYFDTGKGILVYLKNIRLSDSRFDLQCRDELKVFLAKDAAGKPKAGEAGAKAPGGAADQAPPAAGGQGAPKTPAGGDAAGTKPQAGAGNLLGGDFGDIDRLVASGAVRVTRKDAQGLPVVATAETATYEAGSGDVILRGGFPTVRKGKDYLRALEPGLYIRLYANGDVFAQPGKWETGVSKIKDKEQPAKPR